MSDVPADVARASRDTVSRMSEPPEPRPTPILASDAERERSVALLRDAVGEGRLTLEEFSERVGLAQAARTDQELARLTGDLPRRPDCIRSARRGVRGAPGLRLAPDPQRTVVAAGPFVVALDLRHDRPRPAPGATRRPGDRARGLQPVRHGNGDRPRRRRSGRARRRTVCQSEDPVARAIADRRRTEADDRHPRPRRHAVRPYPASPAYVEAVAQGGQARAQELSRD